MGNVEVAVRQQIFFRLEVQGGQRFLIQDGGRFTEFLCA